MQNITFYFVCFFFSFTDWGALCDIAENTSNFADGKGKKKTGICEYYVLHLNMKFFLNLIVFLFEEEGERLIPPPLIHFQNI